MRFTLPISPGYVAHWNLWEAVRELYQNALDVRDRQRATGGTGAAYIYHRDTVLTISNYGDKLSPSTLILGSSTKTEDENQRGKFGEGYKLALLVLCRLGLPVVLLNHDESWTPKIEYDPHFEAEVLNIYVEKREVADYGSDVCFIINGISEDDWRLLQRNMRYSVVDKDEILEEAHEKGRIYVGGLFVCQMEDGFKCGYSLRTKTLPLDRDRGMVNGFDLSLVTSRLWAEREDSDRAVDLLEEEADDVRYVSSHTKPTTALTVKQNAAFVAKHGSDAVPVTSQAEVERAQAAGLKWVLVKQSVRHLLGLVRNFFIPSSKSPVDRLREFATTYQYNLPPAAKAELADIIKTLTPPGTVAPVVSHPIDF